MMVFRKTNLLWIALLLTVAAVSVDSEETDDLDFPFLQTLDKGNWKESPESDMVVRKNGARLLQLPKGLHFLEEEIDSSRDVLIAIHGFGARGYEWVYPLLTLDNEETDSYFLRWAYIQDRTVGEELLLTGLEELIETRGELFTKATFIAHSCGGVLLASVLDRLPEAIEYEVHIVASPVAGLGLFTVCKPDIPETIPDNITVTQWKTQHHLDSVFTFFPNNPQDIGIDFLNEMQLPERYRGKRLGHVRSLSWVADQIVEARKDNQNPESEEPPSEQSSH